MSNNKQYSSHDKVNDVYWRELGVRIDAIDDMTLGRKEAEYELFISNMSVEELNQLIDVLGVKTDATDKEKLQRELLSVQPDQKNLLLKLRDFLNRKKRTISGFYPFISKEMTQTYSTPLAQLYQIYQDSPSRLYSFYTYHQWSVRGSGVLLSLDKEMSKEIGQKLATNNNYETILQNNLYKASGEKNKYRIFSYCIIDSARILVLWYKQVSDISRPDYKEAIRNQEIDELLFELDTENRTLELKIRTETERRAIKKYMEETFRGVFNPVSSEVYREYDKQTFVKSVLHGDTATGKPIADFLVEKVGFRGSPLKNSPEITLQTKNIDVWDSVKDAHEKGSIDLESMKDLANLSLVVGDTRRNIRSTVLQNGNIVFTMDDSMLDIAKKELIKQKFLEKFGIPLFQEISNAKFKDGKADIVDYVMAQINPDNINDSAIEIYQTVMEKNLLNLTTEEIIKCKEKNCTYEERVNEGAEVKAECPLCDNELEKDSIIFIKVNFEKVITFVKKSIKVLEGTGDWKVHNDTSFKYSGKQYKCINLERIIDSRVLQVMVTDEPLSGRLINRLTKQLTPLFIVFVGQQEKYLEKYTGDCIQAINFGKLFMLDKEEEGFQFYTKLYNYLELRAKQFTASAANKAYLSIQSTICLPEEIDKDYNEVDLEDDAYAMIKDMFHNAAKWGKEKSGQAVPEGIFTLSYLRKKGNDLKQFKYAFSYDCKFTRKELGYDINRSEQRKAVEYVLTLCHDDYVSAFSSKNQLSGHIFISNNFNEKQVLTVIQYFSKQLGDEYDTIPVFLTTEDLSYLHEKYRKHYDLIQLAPNVFMEAMYNLFSSKTKIVSKELIDNAFKKALDPELKEHDAINMKRLSNALTP